VGAAPTRNIGLSGSDLSGLISPKINLTGANLERADLTDVENLKGALGLPYANILGVRADPKNRKIIEEAYRARELFAD